MEIQIVSTEKIKPISPTPNHLKLYKISLLDQIIPPAYFPAVLYFAPHPTSISQRIHLLKNSLASTLTHFYPLAGIVKDAFTVDCNDEGLPFFIAEVKTHLKDFLEKPDMQSLNRLLPIEFSWKEGAGPGSNLCTIQLSCFECGGMAICVILAHQIGDITTVSTFLKCWAATARGCEEEAISPDFAASSVFSQKVSMQKESYLFVPLQQFLKLGKFVTRRYVFDTGAISTLQAQSRRSEDDENPTRVEAISAFIWKCFMEAVQEKRGAFAAGKSGSHQNEKPFLLTQAVNLRRRAKPPFPNNSFGNFLWLAAAKCTKSPILGTGLKDLVCELKRAMSRIDNEFMKRLETDNGYYENLEDLRKAIPQEATWFAFSSWAKIGLHDIDFGWGKTVWLSGFVSGDSMSLMPNSAALVETRTGNGIEAWVILDEEFMTTFENNEELKIYARLNPNVHL